MPLVVPLVGPVGCAVGWVIGGAVARGPFVVAVGQGCWSRPLISGIGWVTDRRAVGLAVVTVSSRLPIPGKIQ